MLKKLFKKLQLNLASILLVLFYCLEGVSKIVKFSPIEDLNTSRVFKSIVIIILILGLIHRRFINIIHLLILFIFFSLGQYYLSDGFNTPVVILFFKYIFAIVLFMYFNINKLSESQKRTLFLTFESIIIINSLLIILGFLFDIDLFQTYKGERFGFNGLFVASSSGSYVGILSLLYFLIKYKKALFKKMKAIIVIVSLILVGTKSVYISLFFVGLFYVWYYFDSSFRKITFISLFALLIILAYTFFYSFGVFNEIRQERGIISSVLSFRNELLVHRTIPFIQDQWQWVNYLFGGLINLNTRAQLGFIDTFYFFGIIGGIYYLYLYYRSYFTFVINKKNVCLAIILIIFLSGNFFANTSLPLHLLVLKLMLEETNYSKTYENSISKH